MAEPRAHPRVFSVPPGAPFLKVLADALLSGDLVTFDRTDPLALAGVTVLLPTRRSVRAFSDALIERLGGEAAILPAIRPIGDVDEDEQLLDPFIGEGEDRLALPPAISPLARRLALTRLTLRWATELRRHPLGLSPDEPLRIPASAADATRLAADLARLIDEVAINNVDWNKLATLVPDDHAEYFQLTLGFLKIVSEAWPQYLRDNNRADPASRRDGLIRSAAARLQRQGGPIVAAGSTGSIPATAELLRVIATLPNGAVVLPGLDAHLDPAGWNAIGSDEAAEAATHGHPQFALKQLIATIGIARDDVVALGAAPQECVARAALLSEAMRPAATLDAWAGHRPAPEALAGLDLVVARNEQEEATAIALAIREAVEKPGATAALVTPDRTLARRVAVELGRWGLAIDDSAGARLDREPHGVFARLLAEAAGSSADPVKLLALVKHPFAAFGMAKPLCREAARYLEVALFRGHRVPGGVSGLAAALAAARADKDTSKHLPAARRRLRDREWDLAARLVEALVACLAPLEAAIASETAAAAAATLLRDALTKAATDETGTDDALWQKEGGPALAILLDALADDIEAKSLRLGPGDFPFFLAALLGEGQVPRQPGADPRIHIWGTLEARLQSVDLIVLGALDEGVWPAVPRTDPWLSRAMRAALGLPAPERRLGQAAHDFVQAMAAPRAIVTRAEKRDGAPTVESRWLQRLRALIGKDAIARVAQGGDRLVGLARDLDRPDAVKPALRPAPKPPVAVRPRRLSVTDIEKLIRDPYAIYARRILRLEPLDPLGRAPDAALRGTLMHDTLGRFTGEWAGAFDAAALARLLAVGQESLARIREFPDTYAVWSLRFADIARWFVAWEAGREDGVAERSAELDGVLAIDAPAGRFDLRGRADRIDLLADGSVAIYDFKTGTPQTERTVFAGLTPQMTLEAAMVRAGAFDTELAKRGRSPLVGRNVGDLAWLAIGKAGRGEPYVSAVRKGETADDLATRAHAMLAALIADFDTEDKGYISRARALLERDRFGDYDHLARVREWALVESPEDLDIAGVPR